MASGLNRAQTIGDYLDLAGHQLDVKPQHIKPVRLPAPLTVDELLAVLTHTTAQVDSAFMYLTPPERQQLVDSIHFLLAHLIRHGRARRGTRSEYETCQTALRLAKQSRSTALLPSCQNIRAAVSALSTSSALHYPQASIETPNGLSGPLIYARKTLLGWILIGSKEANFYGRDDILCIIELGGDDVYAMSPRPNVRLYIDYGGDDHYLGAGGSAIGGIEFLIDYEVDDVYTGDALTLGSSFCGIGYYGTLPVTTNTPASAWRRDALFLGQASSLTEPAMMYSPGHRGQGL